VADPLAATCFVLAYLASSQWLGHIGYLSRDLLGLNLGFETLQGVVEPRVSEVLLYVLVDLLRFGEGLHFKITKNLNIWGQSPLLLNLRLNIYK
jgi:hypothetical protein